MHLSGTLAGNDIVPAQEHFFEAVVKMFDTVAASSPGYNDLISLQSYLSSEWQKFSALANSAGYDKKRSAAALSTLKPYVDERLRNVAAWIAAAAPASAPVYQEPIYYAPPPPDPVYQEPTYYAPPPAIETPGIIQINPPAGSGGPTQYVPRPTQAPPPGYSYAPVPAADTGFDLEGWLPWIAGGAAVGFLLLRR